MKVFSYSEIGDHEENEDALAVFPHITDSTVLICALADGQGGRPGGTEASKASVEACLEKAQTFSAKKIIKPSIWMEIGRYVDVKVSSTPDCGYTTFVGMYITPEFVIGVSNGDSAAVLISDENFLLLTQNQYKNPSVGSGAARLTTFSAQLKANWKLVLVSDGVWKYTGWDIFKKRCLTEASKSLISTLREDVIGKNKILPDDFSIILIES